LIGEIIVRPKNYLLILALALLLSACGTKTTPSIEPTAMATSTPEPSPTPAKPMAILIIPADMPDSDSKLYQKTVYDLAQQSGLHFQVRNTLTPAELDPNVKVVVALPPDPGIAALAASAPQTQFLAVNIPGVTAGGNISTIGGAGDSPDIPAFLAGYISAMLATDYRTGMVGEKDSTRSGVAAQAFANGRQYYCGLCNPVAPPWYPYPIVVNMPSDVAQGEANAYADALHDRMVQVAYIYPEVQLPSQVTYLSSLGISMIGENPPPEDARSNWVATIQPKWIAAVQNAWSDIVSGSSGKSYPSPLTLTDINPDLLSEGKQRLAQQMMDDLLAGRVGTGVKP
jgi:hypothetical protein